MNLEREFGPVIDAMSHEQRLALLPEECIIRRMMERKGGREAYRGPIVRDQLLGALHREQQGVPPDTRPLGRECQVLFVAGFQLAHRTALTPACG